MFFVNAIIVRPLLGVWVEGCLCIGSVLAIGVSAAL